MSIFKSGKDWWYNARIDHAGLISNKWELYARGYKLGAEALVEKVMSTQTDQDFLVYPIVFMYRHYVEIRLKEIIERGSKLLDQPYKLPDHHEIWSLWTTNGAKKIVVELYPEGTDEDMKRMEATFKSFARYDVVSSSFRYPIDLKGNPSFDNSMKEINIRHLAEELNFTVTMLEGITEGIYHFEDDKNDMIADNMSNIDF